MHIFLVTQYFPPEVGAAPSRWGDYVQIMLSRGHKVTVLCEIPNYPYGKFFSGYKFRWIKKETISKNFIIYRSAVFANDRSTSVKKLLHYLSFAFSSIINSFRVKKFDLLIISSPPIFIGFVGIIQKKIMKKDYWLDVRDLWPESIAALISTKKSFFYKIGKKIESSLYHNAKGLITPVPGFEKYFNINQYSKEKPKLILQNGISLDFLNKIKNSPKLNIEKFTVFFSGNFGLAQGLKSIINAAEILKDFPIKFILIGDGVKKNQVIKLVNRKKINNISFHDPVGRDELINWIKKASLCIVPLKDDPLFKTALPSKMFEYMACSKPILCPQGDAGDLIKDINAGTVFVAENSNSISDSILYYFNNREKIVEHGSSGFNYVSKYLIKEDLLDNMLVKIKEES